MTKKLMRGLVPVMVLSAAVALFTGCGSKDSGADSKPAGDSKETTAEAGKDSGSKGTSSKDTLIIATANETPSVTTNLHNATAGDYINQMTHEGLFTSSVDLTPQPALAESYEIVSDTEWVFKLRQGVKFHNGQEVKAADVKASLELCKESPQVSQYGDAVESVEVIDDYTVKITTNGPHSGLLTDLSHHGNAILPADLIASGHDFNKEPIGTGPYKFVAWNKGESIELEANEDYWGGAPAIKTVETVLIAESSQAQIELENGNIDWVTGPDNMDIARIQSGSVSGLKTMEMPAALVKNIWFNFRSEPMRDVNVRKAINCAIDKEAIIAVAYGGSATVANQKIANNNGAYDPAYDENPMYPYDIELAKEYLSKSAYPEGLKLTIYSDTTPAEVHILECVKNDLAKIGIEVKIFNLDSNVAVPTLIAGEEDDMYAAIGCTSVGYAPGYLKNCSPDMVPNWGAWPLVECDEAINDLYVKSLATTDVDECNKLVKEAIRLELENAMSVPVCYPISYMTCSEKLQGVTINGGNCTFLLADAYFEG